MKRGRDRPSYWPILAIDTGNRLAHFENEPMLIVWTYKLLDALSTRTDSELESTAASVGGGLDDLKKAIQEFSRRRASSSVESSDKPKPPTQYINLKGSWDGPTEQTKTKWYGKAKAGFPWIFTAEFGWSREVTKSARSRGYSAVKKRALADYLDELEDWEHELKASGRWSERKELPRMAWLALKSTVYSGFGIVDLVQKINWRGKRKRR